MAESDRKQPEMGYTPIGSYHTKLLTVELQMDLGCSPRPTSDGQPGPLTYLGRVAFTRQGRPWEKVTVEYFGDDHRAFFDGIFGHMGGLESLLKRSGVQLGDLARGIHNLENQTKKPFADTAAAYASGTVSQRSPDPVDAPAETPAPNAATPDGPAQEKPRKQCLG